jgi:UDP-2-acetamido-2,6-beta-L-arabino-hexul-4-ose reductase
LSAWVPFAHVWVPAWRTFTNIGDDELVVMLWANEIFDRQKPDTVAIRVA